MKRILTAVSFVLALFMWINAANASTVGSDVHNGPDVTTGYITVPWSHGHYSNVPTFRGVGIAPHVTTAKKTAVKCKMHFKSKASKAAFDRWYFATHK